VRLDIEAIFEPLFNQKFEVLVKLNGLIAVQ